MYLEGLAEADPPEQLAAIFEKSQASSRRPDVPRFWLRFSCELADGRRESRGLRVGGGGDVE